MGREDEPPPLMAVMGVPTTPGRVVDTSGTSVPEMGASGLVMTGTAGAQAVKRNTPAITRNNVYFIFTSQSCKHGYFIDAVPAKKFT